MRGATISCCNACHYRSRVRQVCRECFYAALEDEVHQTIVQHGLFKRGDRVAIGASGGKDSTVLAHMMTTLNARHGWVGGGGPGGGRSVWGSVWVHGSDGGGGGRGGRRSRARARFAHARRRPCELPNAPPPMCAPAGKQSTHHVYAEVRHPPPPHPLAP